MKNFNVRFNIQQPDHCSLEQAQEIVAHMRLGYSTSDALVSEDLIEEWRRIHAQGAKIDETSRHDGHDWQSLCIGYALGRGLSLEEACEFYGRMVQEDLF